MDSGMCRTSHGEISAEVMLTPADLETLRRRKLGGAVCVVFDVLRATTSMVTALGNGAEAIEPVQEIEAALAARRARPEVLLAGERQGLRIDASLTGGVEFDLGNSPREFTAERVRGRRIVMTTTNGTRALRACQGARTVLVGSFLNLGAIARWLLDRVPRELVIVCSGTFEELALEDALAAGALWEAVASVYGEGRVTDAVAVAGAAWQMARDDLPAALARARNGRRLLSQPELRDDVAFCAQRDTLPFVAMMDAVGCVRRADSHALL